MSEDSSYGEKSGCMKLSQIILSELSCRKSPYCVTLYFGLDLSFARRASLMGIVRIWENSHSWQGCLSLVILSSN